MIDNLRVLYFYVMSGDTRDVFKREHGPMESKMRTRTLELLVKNAILDTFGRLESADAVNNRGPNMERYRVGALVKQEWIGSRYNKSPLLKHHAKTAREAYENTYAEKTSYVRKLNIYKCLQPTADDIGLFAMSWVLSELNQAESVSRKFAGDIMFLKLGYIFEKWEGFGTQSVKKDTLKIQWVVSYDEGEIINVSKIPEWNHVSKQAAPSNEEVYS